jgi:hypothetical protein
MNEMKSKKQYAITCLASGFLLLFILLIELLFVTGEFFATLIILICTISLIMLYLIACIRFESPDTEMVYSKYGCISLIFLIIFALVYLSIISLYKIEILTTIFKLFICAVLSIMTISGACILFTSYEET